MVTCSVRTLLTCLAAGMFSHGLCQTAAALEDRVEPVTYQQFFERVAQLRSVPAPIVVGGQVIQPEIPSIQKVIGLSDADVSMLNAVAYDCATEIAWFRQAAAPLIFESRLQLVESGKHSDSLERRLADLETQRNQMVLTYVKRLNAALGKSSFDKVVAYLLLPPETRNDLTPSFPSAKLPAAVSKN